MRRFRYLSLFLSLLSYPAFCANVSFFVFDKEVPAENYQVEYAGKIFSKKANRPLKIELPKGKHQLVLIDHKEGRHEMAVEVTSDEPHWINYTFHSAKEVLSDKTIKETELKDLKFYQLTGQILDSQKKRPVAAARILVHGGEKEFRTDAQGRFTIDIPTGNQHISILHKNFSTRTIRDIEVQKNFKMKDIYLKPSGLELEEFVVISPNLKSSVNALLEVRKGYKTVADLIGSEQISKTGDSDASGSLRRVTGLSLVDGKYVYVRGLGERYSSTLLNGSMIPSPDPSRRVIPLDLFPASIIENMVVQKGYSAHIPGDFGGGTVDIKTKSIPEKAFFKFSVSDEFMKDDGIKTYRGGNSDFLGRDTGVRSLPSGIKGKKLSDLSSSERKSLAQKIDDNYKTVELTDGEDKSHPSFSIAAGKKHRFNKLKLGYNVSVLKSSSWDLSSSEQVSYNQTGSGLVEDSSKEVTQSTNTEKFAGLVGIGAEYKRHKLKFNGSLLRKSTLYVNESDGMNSEKENYKKTELGWRERSVDIKQLQGEHIIKALNRGTFAWNVTQSKAELYEPDNKMYKYIDSGSGYEFETENGSAGNSLTWNEMPDEMSTSQVSYTQPIDLENFEQFEAKIGAHDMSRSRVYRSNTYYMKFSDDVDASEDPDIVMGNPNNELHQQANNTDNYSAKQKINGAFTQLDLQYNKVKVSSGIRFEKSVQEVESYKLFDAGKTVSELTTEDYLPHVTVTYQFTDKLLLKSSVSETVSRPDLREISNTVWNDIQAGAKYKGNPNLKAAEITNYDMRLEWFFNRGELLSIGYFRKDFLRPIEEIFGSLSDDGRVVGTTETQYTFLNIDSATNQGIEFEFRKKMNHDFTFSGNYSFIESQVEISEDRAGQLTSLERPLQGQSPYLLNLQLDYEAKGSKTKWSLLYNEMGRRITGVGADKRPDEYQEKISSFDLVASYKMNKNWSLKVKTKNLLDPEVKKTQGNKVTKNYKKGQSLKVGLNAVF